ncbi:hypothetical protein JVT61DRAFT_7342 [Boletus reticuloceps]|uniref:Uncharacterized protein n=1 Tax=Boletus reticuloceps TaxID=495285 RepID=A0A8I2YJN1_9AGAM|nr:hypothetical protein JVT61DRAFT_7342 [Boletus reticuloceps]
MDGVWPAALRAHELLSGCDPLNKDAFKHPPIRTTRHTSEWPRTTETRCRARRRLGRCIPALTDARSLLWRELSRRIATVRPTLALDAVYPDIPGDRAWTPGDFSPTTSLQASQPSYYTWPSTGPRTWHSLGRCLHLSCLKCTARFDRRATLTSLDVVSTRTDAVKRAFCGWCGRGGQAGYESASGGRYPNLERLYVVPADGDGVWAVTWRADAGTARDVFEWAIIRRRRLRNVSPKKVFHGNMQLGQYVERFGFSDMYPPFPFPLSCTLSAFIHRTLLTSLSLLCRVLFHLTLPSKLSLFVH